MIDRDKLKEEFNQLRLEQSNISSRIKAYKLGFVFYY